MSSYIVQHRRGSTARWNDKNTIIPMEGEIVIEIDEVNSLHKLKIGDGIHTYAELAYLQAGDEIVTQVLAEAKPRVVSVALAEIWNKDAEGKYSQTISLDNITKHSRLDLQPTADMLAELKQLGVVFVTENNDGVITVYSVGNMPTKAYTMQATIVETECSSTNIIGIPVGTPAVQVEQEIGTSTTATMSQNAITEQLNNKMDLFKEEIITFSEGVQDVSFTLTGKQFKNDITIWTNETEYYDMPSVSAYSSNWSGNLSEGEIGSFDGRKTSVNLYEIFTNHYASHPDVSDTDTVTISLSASTCGYTALYVSVKEENNLSDKANIVTQSGLITTNGTVVLDEHMVKNGVTFVNNSSDESMIYYFENPSCGKSYNLSYTLGAGSEQTFHPSDVESPYEDISGFWHVGATWSISMDYGEYPDIKTMKKYDLADLLAEINELKSMINQLMQ